jgi:hypothetical protein
VGQSATNRTAAGEPKDDCFVGHNRHSQNTEAQPPREGTLNRGETRFGKVNDRPVLAFDQRVGFRYRLEQGRCLNYFHPSVFAFLVAAGGRDGLQPVRRLVPGGIALPAEEATATAGVPWKQCRP